MHDRVIYRISCSLGLDFVVLPYPDSALYDISVRRPVSFLQTQSYSNAGRTHQDNIASPFLFKYQATHKTKTRGHSFPHCNSGLTRSWQAGSARTTGLLLPTSPTGRFYIYLTASRHFSHNVLLVSIQRLLGDCRTIRAKAKIWKFEARFGLV